MCQAKGQNNQDQILLRSGSGDAHLSSTPRPVSTNDIKGTVPTVAAGEEEAFRNHMPNLDGRASARSSRRAGILPLLPALV